MVQERLDSGVAYLVIVGPTSSGKSAVGMQLALKLQGEIVSADSRQIYAGLEIGSGAPTADERSIVPHHLVAVDSPWRRTTAGDFARRARQAIVEIADRGKTPILVGGSGLYVRATVEGLALAPPADQTVRAEIEAEISRFGMQEMIGRLAGVDPSYAPSVGVNDRKRLVRALEVFRISGVPFSDWHRTGVQPVWGSPRCFGLERPRAELRELIEQRVEAMFAAGWIDEVTELLRAGELPDAAAEALGYRSIIDVIRGRTDIPKAKEEIIIATRQFAKRQMTWFKRTPGVEWLQTSGERAVEVWSESILSRLQAVAEPEGAA